MLCQNRQRRHYSINQLVWKYQNGSHFHLNWPNINWIWISWFSTKFSRSHWSGGMICSYVTSSCLRLFKLPISLQLIILFFYNKTRGTRKINKLSSYSSLTRIFSLYSRTAFFEAVSKAHFSLMSFSCFFTRLSSSLSWSSSKGTPSIFYARAK